MKGVEGVNRFLNRAWRLMAEEEGGEILDLVTDAQPNRDQLRLLHATIRKVSEDIENLRFNTAISAMMTFVNEANKWTERPRAVLEPFLLILSPFDPHLAEELWQKSGGKSSRSKSPPVGFRRLDRSATT